MTTPPQERTLRHDSKGTALWIERESRAMDDMQMFREFVQNGTEAGANTVIVDGWVHPASGRTLARITDNGTGMTADELKNHLITLHGQFKGDENYGVGGRIASLPRNQKGVVFASRVDDDGFLDESMVLLHKRNGEYSVKLWETEDPESVDGKGYEEIMAPYDGMLERLPVDAPGTAVILYGDGKSNTWDSSISYQVHKWLGERFYTFGDDALGEPIRVMVEDYGKGHLRTVTTVEAYLSEWSDKDANGEPICGHIPFEDVAGLSGSMLWAIVPSSAEATRTRRDVRNGGIGLKVGDEIFNYSRSYSGAFGIIYPKVQQKVVILIDIFGAEMNTSRSNIVLPGENRTNTPWQKLGAFFAAKENMPPEIDALLTIDAIDDNKFDEELAKMLDAEWMKKLKPIRVPTAKKPTDAEIDPDNPGDIEKARKVYPPKPGPKPVPGPTPVPRPFRQRKPRPKVAAGSQPGGKVEDVKPPNVLFKDPEDFDYEQHPFGITWYGVINEVHVSKTFYPYVREVEEWVRTTTVSRKHVEKAVQGAYKIELAATIVDANGQSQWKLTPDQVEELKKDGALYAKALGMQAMTDRVETFIKAAVRS